MSDSEFIIREGPAGFTKVWKKVMLDPRAFYNEMPANGGFENPIIFLSICALIFFALKMLVAGVAAGVNGLFLLCLCYAFGPGILMLVSQYLFQGEGDYESSLRVCAYAGACLTLAWLPLLGVFAYLYSFYLIFLGTEKTHKLNAEKAAVATLVAILVTAAIMFFVLGEERIRRPLL